MARSLGEPGIMQVRSYTEGVSVAHAIRHLTGAAKPGPPNDRPPAPAGPPPPRWRMWLLPAGILITLLLFTIPHMTGTTTKNLTYSKFLSEVTAGDVRTASVNPGGALSGSLKGGDNYTSQIPTAIDDQQLAPTLKAHDVNVTGVGAGSALLGDLLAFLPLLLFVAFFIYIGRRNAKQLSGGIMGFGGSKAKVYDEEKPTTRFTDIAGYEGSKREVSEVVDFLSHPERYARAGAVGPRGVLMVGPPGTGKTLMARAVAGESGVPFLALTGSSFVELFVGVGASRVRDLFADARKRAPCIIFIDEIDAIGQRRGGSAFGSNDEREQTLNQLLAEMDGFDPTTGVVVMAATNRPEILDPALLRPGRFDREVEIPLPNQAERAAILAVHVKGKHLAPDVDFDKVARATPGFSGADLANLINEAAIVAIRDNRDVIYARDIDEARDRVLLGRRDGSNALLPEEKRSVAIHEAGHALVAFLSEHADPVAKITILPAGRALGVTEQLPVDERHLYSESYLFDSLAVRLGGRASEILVVGEASTGAASDLSGATQLAMKMVTEWGLSPRLGPIGYGTGDSPQAGPVFGQERPYAEGTQQIIDEEVSRLLTEAEDRARALLGGNRDALDAVVAALLEKETISGDDLAEIVGRTQQKTSGTPAVVGT
jgi:cell division protease FtsH